MFKSTSYFRELCSRTTRVFLSGILGLCLVFIFSWVLTANNKASALTSSTINYQARLLQSNGAIAPDGNYNVDFKLYSSLSTGGGQAVGTCTDTGGFTCLWEETYTGGNVVTVKDGYLTVNLGSITSFPSTINWGSQLYLTMNIGGTGGSPTWDGEMSPRIQLTSVPYAFESNLAITADTLTDVSGAYTDTLQLTAPTAASNTITVPDATGTVCLQSSASCGFLTGSGTAILQGGNSLGATVTIGSTAAYGVNLITSNNIVESLSATGAATFENSTNSTSAFQIQNASGNDLLNANTTTSSVNINGLSAPGTVSTTLAPTINATTTSGTPGAVHYTYEVVAAGPNGSFTYPSPTNTVTTGNATLSSGNYNIVSWGTVTGATNYYVYRSATTGSAPLGLIGVVASGTTTLNDKGQTPTGTAPALTGGLPGTSTAYYFKVTAIDGTGGQTTASAETSSITETTTTNNAIDLSWAPETGARGYDVYYATSSGAETNGYFTTYTNNYEFTTTTGTTAGSIPTVSTAYNNTLSTSGNSQVTIGNTAGSASTAQLDVAGSLPTSAIGTVATGSGSGPYANYVQGSYDYVINSSNNSLQVIDVSNPANPVIVGSVATGSNPSDINVQGNYAYVTNDASVGSLQIFNISNPASPVVVSTFATSPYPLSVSVQGNYAYVITGSSNSVGTLQVINISNPASPVVTASINTYGGSFIYVQGNYAYVAGLGANILLILNISNPVNPLLVSSITIAQADSVYVQGRYAYVASASTNDLYTVDVSNPASPVIVSSISGAAGDVFVQSHYVYTLNGSTNAISVFDISNPANPISIGSISTGAGSNPGINSLYVQGRYAYLANDGANSLQIFDLGGAYIQQLQVGGAEVGTLQVDSNANVNGAESINGGLTVGNSAQISGSLGVGSNLTVTGLSQLEGVTAINGVYGGYSSIGLATPSAPSVSFSGISGSVVTWSYEVEAIDAAGNTTAASAVGSITTGDSLGLGAYPAQTVTSTSFATPHVTYNVPSGQPFLTGMGIYVSSCNGTGGDNGTYTITSETTNTIVVSNAATGAAGETGCIINSENNSNNISWTAISGAVNYYVFRTVDAAGGSPSTTGYIGSTTGTSLNDIGLAGTATYIAQATDSTNSFTYKTATNSATALSVQNASGSQIFGINTSTGQTVLGNNSVSPIAGSIVLDNGNNSTPAAVTINTNAAETANFTITLPSTGASGGLCLESSTASTSSATTLQFNSCANNSPTISVDTINTWPKSGTATSGSTATISAFTPSTDGDLLLVTTSIPASGGSVKTSPIGISDSDVTSWNKAVVSPASGSALRVEMWYGVVTGTSSAALTVTYTGTITSGTAEVDVTEFTAVGVNSATTWGVDTSGATTGTTSSGTPINMYNNTPGNSGELYYGFANDQSAGLGSGGSCPNVPSVGTTWTCTTSAGGQANVVDYDLNTTAGTVGGYNGQIYLGATSYNYSSIAALFLAFVNSTAINNAVSTQEANFNVQAGAPGTVAGVLESNGSGDSLDLQNSAGIVASSFNTTGSLTVGNNNLTNQTASAVAFATPTVTYTVPNGYIAAIGQTITVASCSGTGADSGTFVVTAVGTTTIAVSNTLGVASETGCIVTTGSEGIINLEDENTAGTATGEVSLEAGIPSGSTSYNYSLLLPTTNPSTGLCLETSTASALQLVFNSCASNNPSISLQTTTGYGNNEWDTHAGTSGLTTTLTTYPETKGDLEVMTTQIPNGTSNGVTVASVSGGGVTLWHKAAVDPGNSAVDRVEVWYGIVTGLSPHSLASQTVSATTFGTPNLTYTVPTGQPFITGEYITVTGCSGTGGDNGAYSVAGFTTTSITVSDPTNGVAGETGCTVNPGWPVTVTYTPSTPGTATEVTDSEFTAVGVLPSSSWGVDTSGNSLISSASTSLSGPTLTAATSGELYYSYANEQTASVTPEGYATCTGSPAYNCIATGQGNVIDYNDQTVLSTAYQSAWTISPTALESNDVSVLFEAFISSTAINNTTSVQEANFDVQAATSGSVAGVLQANAAGNADILDLYNGGGTKEFTVSNTGLTTIGDSATISLVQSAWANATATGTASVSATSSLPLADWSTTQTKGDVVTLGIECASTSASVAEITGGNVSNWYNVTTQSANGYDNEIWEGTITTTATATQINITYNLNGAWSANCEVTGQEFSASVPSGATPVWSVTSSSDTITGAAATSVPVPTMTASQYGELYWSYDVTQHAATEPALQAPYFYQLTGDSKTIVYDTTFGPGTTNPTNNITQTSGTYNDVAMVLSASTGSNLTDNGGAIFTGSDAQTDLQVIGASGSGAAVLNADTLNNRVNVDGTLTILASPVLATPTASGSGSALVASQYCYEVTAIDGTGAETTPSNEKCITPTLGQNITFTWGAVPGAVSYRVYRTVAAGATGSETFLYDATQLTFTDVGAYTPSGTIYPPSSTSAYGNSTVVNSTTAGTALTTGINTNLQLTIGGNGSPTGQVYVSGTLPSGVLGTATIGGNGEPFGLAVQGNYAYISFDVTDKLAVYDVTNPANPVLVGQANTLAAPWYLAVAGHYVYVTDRSGNALQIYDVSNPASPELISTLTTDMNDPSAVFVSGNYAYISNAGSSTAGLEIVNVSNPYNPTVASIIPTGTSANSPWNVFVQGRYAYAVDSSSSAMYIIDVSSPTQPILDSTFTLTGDPSQVYVSGSYAYLSIGNDIQIVNIDNPYDAANADILATNTGGEDCTGTSASYLEGNYLYVACDNGSTPTVPVEGTMEQIDVTNPYSPVISGTVPVGLDPQTLWIQGRYAYVDDETGFTLSVFDLGGIYSSSIQAGGLNTGTLGVASNALIGGTLSVGAGFTVGGSTDINGSLNAYGGAYIAGNTTLSASVGIPIPSSPTVTATCASACNDFYFYGVSATDSNGGSTLMSQSGGPTEVSGVPPVDYVSNNAALSDTTNNNAITIDPDQGTTDSITSYGVYTCKETTLSGTGTPPTSSPPHCGITTNYTLVANIATASETANTAASTTFATPILTYNTAGTPTEVQYQKVTVTGCSSAGDNGTFVVTAVGGSTIAVYDTGGAAIASTAGCSIVGDLLAEDYGASSVVTAPTTTTAENSTTAFQIQDAAGNGIVNVDTVNDLVDLNYSAINFNNVTPPGALTIGSYSGSTGPNGTYYYVVTYTTIYGQTNYSTVSAQANTSGTAKNINLTGIPTGPAGIVTARNIYRTVTTGLNTGPFYLVTTIANDTATTYTDATADGSLGTAVAPAINATNGTGLLQVDGTSVFQADANNKNVSIGADALLDNTGGVGDFAIGYGSLESNTIGDYNYAIGANALNVNTTGSNNVALGDNDLELNLSGSGNIAIGDYTGENLTTGSTNILIGYNLSAISASTSNELNIGGVLQGNTSTGSALFQNASNSATAFVVETSGGSPVPLLTVNTTADDVIIGNGLSGDTTGYPLVLDSKTGAITDPTYIQGGMYYNAYTSTFRCGVNGAWANCLGGGLLSSNSSISTVNTCTTVCSAFTNNASLASNYCTPGRVITISMSGVYSNNQSGTETVSLGVYWGTNTAKSSDTIIGTPSPTFAMAGSASNLPWSLSFQINCLTATTAIGGGVASFGASTSAITPEWMNATTASTITTTSAENVYVFPAFGFSNAGVTISANTISITGN